MPPSASDYRS